LLNQVSEIKKNKKYTMKITFILPHAGLSGGIRVVAIYAERLRKRGHEIFVVSVPKRPLSLKAQVKSLLKQGRWITSPKATSSYFDTIDVPHKVTDHPSPVTDDDVPDADVVIATWWATAEWVARLSPTKGTKAYFIQHHELHDYLPKERVKATYALPFQQIAISKWLVNILQNEYGSQNISFVPNSVDFDQFNAPPRSKQRIPTVGVMYSPTYWKGCDISLKAFSLAAKEIPNLQLIAFGTQEPVENLPLPPQTNYTCQPPQHHLKELYAQCDAWLFGSRVEGFGLPILEAMACRTPVIATPAGAAPELLASGGGLLVKPEDPEDMAKAIQQICKLSHGEWQKVSNAAHQQATSYTWDDATDLFEQALYTAIERQQT
jgi:glycosyltransferase involved in cell wall biosynthesis